MKTSVLYIHGGEAFSNYDVYLENLKTQPLDPYAPARIKWRTTLAPQLGEDYDVLIPQMPNAENAKYIEWKIWFERYIPYVHDGAILIGHSQGGYFLAKYLIENDLPLRIKALYLVAAPFESADFGGEDGGDFNFDTSRAIVIQEKVDHVVICHSEDDPVVPFDHALKYIKAIPRATFLKFEDKSHFWQPTFPELIEDIKGLG